MENPKFHKESQPKTMQAENMVKIEQLFNFIKEIRGMTNAVVEDNLDCMRQCLTTIREKCDSIINFVSVCGDGDDESKVNFVEESGMSDSSFQSIVSASNRHDATGDNSGSDNKNPNLVGAAVRRQLPVRGAAVHRAAARKSLSNWASRSSSGSSLYFAMSHLRESSHRHTPYSPRRRVPVAENSTLESGRNVQEVLPPTATDCVSQTVDTKTASAGSANLRYINEQEFVAERDANLYYNIDDEDDDAKEIDYGDDEDESDETEEEKKIDSES